jgi:acyl-CoA synthetase (AMP-forming)/AMP-acid ligase II
MRPGATTDEAELIAHTKTRLASYKAPRRIRFVDSIGRAPTGKVDYARHSAETAEWARTVPAN